MGVGTLTINKNYGQGYILYNQNVYVNPKPQGTPTTLETLIRLMGGKVWPIYGLGVGTFTMHRRGYLPKYLDVNLKLLGVWTVTEYSMSFQVLYSED